jgi:azurin
MKNLLSFRRDALKGLALAALLLSSAGLAQAKTLNIASVGETMTYDKTALEAKAGEQVTLVFKNNSKTSNLEHNWVLAKPGTEAAVAQAGIVAGAAKNWFEKTADVIANTKMVKPGQTDKITFTAPAAGEYPYLCTFPGHAAMMKGVLKVK